MKTILVTGGAGYIGSHTCVELLNSSYDVIILDNFCNSDAEVVRRIEKLTQKKPVLYNKDLRDIEAVRTIFKSHSIDAVIHFAGLKAVGESVQKPLSYYENNLLSTFVLTQVMSEFGVHKLVFSSSATVYGDPASLPIKEEAPVQATNPYGHTKAMIEQILEDLSKTKKEWAITSLRYFNPVGAHPSGEIGENPSGTPNNLLPFVSQVAVGHHPHLKIFGNDYPTPDGTGVRDYIHIVDLARAHLKALEHLASNPGYHLYNVGTGKGYSVLEIVAAFEKASQKKIPTEIISRRSGDIAECYANADKAQKDLGWKAEKSLDEMCQDAWRWQSSNPNGFKK